MADLHITDLEAAINWWRERQPAGPGAALVQPLAALAALYARMVYERATTCDATTLDATARAAWLQWYDSTPDTPCIAICSTAQGDGVCKGCGRRFEEVRDWAALDPWAKRAVWQRITAEGTAWRFNRYADRAARPGDDAWA